MTEEELAPGRSSVAVNNCIRQLSYHKNNLHDPMSGGWGEVRAQAGVVVVLWECAGSCEMWEIGLVSQRVVRLPEWVGLSSTLWSGCVTQADTMRGGCRTVTGMTRAMGTFIRVRPPGGWSDS